jgi:hypothetical protein
LPGIKLPSQQSKAWLLYWLYCCGCHMCAVLVWAPVPRGILVVLTVLLWLWHAHSAVLREGLQGASLSTCTMKCTGCSNATRLILLWIYSKEYFLNQNVNDLCERFQLYLPSRTAQVYARV